jgi:ornithine--oxo-acid transaminase
LKKEKKSQTKNTTVSTSEIKTAKPSKTVTPTKTVPATKTFIAKPKTEIRKKNIIIKDIKNFQFGLKNKADNLELYDLTGHSLYGQFQNYILSKSSTKTRDLILREQSYGCNNYGPLPVVLNKSEGIYVKDVDDRIYIDFLAAYSALNQGHNNTILISEMTKQASQIYMTSRAFYNEKLGEAAEYICKLFNYEKVLFSNGGVEAGESAVKISRRWGYQVKGIPKDQAKIVFANGNFWGRTTYACATSDDPSRYHDFGPFETNSHYLVEFNNAEAMEDLLKSDPTICSVFLEPIQGENGVFIPHKDYLKKVQNLCKQYNVLLICDEIQTGCGRAGRLLASEQFEIRPDIVCLGKSLSGGIYPISAVLTSRTIMDLIKPGDHGSTFGGNPLASAITLAAMKDLVSKNLVANSYDMGLILGSRFSELKNCKILKEVRGRGLMFGLEFHEDIGFSAYHFSLWLMERGILTKPTKCNILR